MLDQTRLERYVVCINFLFFEIHISWYIRVALKIYSLRANFSTVGEDYLKHFDDFRWKLHEGGIRDPPVDPIDEYARPDGVRDRTELWLLVSLPSRGGELPGESRRQPFAHFRRHRVRLHLRQLIVFVRQPSKGGKREKRC